ncbi:uncharacterized protein DUF1311 [Nitrospirillum pindoramense]|uniref:Uncharacterized protein DUF1311 n=1 Tax=Nitrospirillum amazonense TaxID=28077 RepID=A0A560H7Y4_9PROT|nr:uncharacterized protein DUF1311 [Nitrospirillum amazonense]
MSRLPFLSTTALFLSGLAQAAAGPSFDCAAAANATEKAICADPKLAALDSDIATLYKEAMAKAGPSADSLKVEQRRWLQGRDGLFPVPGKARDKAPSDGASMKLLADRLAFRRAALMVLKDQVKPLPLCQRAAETLRVLRGSDGEPARGGPKDLLFQSGLFSQSAPGTSLAPALAEQLTKAASDIQDSTNRDVDDLPIIVSDRYALVKVPVSGASWQSCWNFVAFQLGSDGKFQALPNPDGMDDGFCGDDVGFDMMDTVGTPSSRPALITWAPGTVSIRETNGAQWNDACDIDVSYEQRYVVTVGTCEADETTCQAFKSRLAEWAHIRGGPEPDLKGPGTGYRYPELGDKPIDEGGPDLLKAFPALKDWTNTEEEGGANWLWHGPREELRVDVSPLVGPHEQELDNILVGAWRQRDGQWVPAAAFIMSPQAIGAPMVKATVTLSKATKR